MKRKFLYIVITIFVLASCGILFYPGGFSAAASSPLADYRQQQKQLAAQMDTLKGDIKEKNKLIGDYQEDIAGLDAQLVTVQKQISALNNSINETNSQIDGANIAIADAEVRLSQRQATLESRLVDIYMYGDISMLDVFFEAASFNDFVVTYDMVERLMEQDQQILADIQAEKELIQRNKALLLERKSDLDELKNEQQTQAAQLNKLQAQKYAAMDEANMTVAQLKASLDSLDEASEKVGKQIRNLLAASDNTISFGGQFTWPLPGSYGLDSVTSEYGNRIHPILNTKRMHTGIDIGAPNGTQIYAAADGKILYVGWVSGYGQTVMIDHGSSITTLYGHMSGYGKFSTGQYVSAGDIIGYVGSTGVSSGNHLHFEVRVNGNHTSPWNYLK